MTLLVRTLHFYNARMQVTAAVTQCQRCIIDRACCDSAISSVVAQVHYRATSYDNVLDQVQQTVATEQRYSATSKALLAP